MRNSVSVEVHDQVDSQSAFAHEVGQCWQDVANSGGAVGFPFPPVDRDTVAAAVTDLCADIDAGHVVLVVARVDVEFVGWVAVRLNRSRLTSHWATIEHLQSHPDMRSKGIGRALLDRAVDHAHARGLDHLLLARCGRSLDDERSDS